jgi:hypothetical protein
MKKYILISIIASMLTIFAILGLVYWGNISVTNTTENENMEVINLEPDRLTLEEAEKAGITNLIRDTQPIKMVKTNFLVNLNLYIPEKWSYKENDRVGEISFDEANKAKVFKFQLVSNENGEIDIADGGFSNSFITATKIGKERLLSNFLTREPEKAIDDITLTDEVYKFQITNTSSGISIDKFTSNNINMNRYIWTLTKNGIIVYVEGEFADSIKEDFFEDYILTGFEIKETN